MPVGGSTGGSSFGLVRYQYPALLINVGQRLEYAGFGSGFGLSLDFAGMADSRGTLYIKSTISNRFGIHINNLNLPCWVSILRLPVTRQAVSRQ